MALRPETSQHLARAEHHHDVARMLCDPQQTTAVQPLPVDWAAVAAFYAAVHYVHAFLWERHSLSPTDHRSRAGYVARTAPLKQVQSAYSVLYDLGWQARYQRTFRPKPGDVQTAVHQHLEAIRRLVYQTLGEPSP